MNRAAWVALCLAGFGYAQQSVQPSSLAVSKRRAERALQAVDSRLQRLVDMRMRHDLGLLLELDADVVAVDGEASALAMDSMRKQLAELRASNAVLAGDYDAVRSMVADLHQKAGRGAPEPAGRDVGLSIPTPGARAAYADAGSAEPDRVNDLAAAAASIAAAPLTETQRPHRRDESLQLDPVVTLIHGSADHDQVARALFKAGQALMDRAAALRSEGQLDAAKDVADAAKERLDRAVVELRPLTDRPDAAFSALFYTSRSLELLFRYDERYGALSLSSNRGEFQRRAQAVRDPLLKILSRPEDAAVATDAAWRQAAKTADEHFRWMNINSVYDVNDEIEALTWPGRGRE